MNLRQFTLMDPTDDVAWLDFLSANEMSHQTIAARIEVKGQVVTRYPLSGDPRHDTNWLQDHNNMHQSEGSILGLPLQDLSDVDLKDPAQFADWMFLHAAVHAAENDILGIF